MTIPSYEITPQEHVKPPVLHVDSIAQMLRGHHWAFDAHLHEDRHQIFWINRGTGRMEIEGQTRGFGPNTVVFIPAGTVHAFEFGPSSAGWVATMAHTSPIPITLPEKALQFQMNAREDQAALTAICDEINKEQASGNSQKEVALTCQAGLLSVWLTRHLETIETPQSKLSQSRKLMIGFRNLLEAKFATEHSVSHYATALGVTPTHLTRVCRQTTGHSATTIIQNRTLLEAKRHLAATDMKIAEIGQGLGFASSAYFTRLFTQKSDQSPSQFRKASRQILTRAATPAQRILA